MAAGEEIVRISYANLEHILFSTQSDATDHRGNSEDKSLKHQKSRRPAQQIYRPGQLRQPKGQRPTHRNGEGHGYDEGRHEQDDWGDGVDVKVNSADEDKTGREGSGDINELDLHVRLDNLYIDSPPRELSVKTVSNRQDQLAGGLPCGLDTSCGHLHGLDMSGGLDMPSDNHDHRGETEKVHGARRGKRPDIKIYVPKGRLGERENRSEDKDSIFDELALSRSEDLGQFCEIADEQEEFDEIIVSDSADSPRMVHMKAKGGSMRVTVMNELPGSEGSASTSRTEMSSVQRKELTESDTSRKQLRPKDVGQRNTSLQQANQKGSKPLYENSETVKGRSDFKHHEVSNREEIRKQTYQKQGVRSYSQNRRSNSSDSRPHENQRDKKRMSKSGKEEFSSDTFPRTKAPGGKNVGREVVAQSKGGKDAKGYVRDGERFYWGTRRQRTGSVSSETSLTSNPSNGSFYSGSSDFTEDDEPEHILNWGEEVEKAHLEELARLVHDGTQKLTSCLDAYPNNGPLSVTVVSGSQESTTTKTIQSTNEHRLVSSNKARQGHDKEGRTRRRRKNSSQQVSRDSSVHSSNHGDGSFTGGGSHRRRRRRQNSHGSQGSYEHQQQRTQQHFEGRYVGESVGDGHRGNRSGLQVTVGHNNRHVEISRGSARYHRPRSHEKWDAHVVKDYDVDKEEEPWDRELDDDDGNDFQKSGGSRQYSQQRWEQDMPPRFRRESGGGSGGRGRMGSGSQASRESEQYSYHGNRYEDSDNRVRCRDDQDCRRQLDPSGGGAAGNNDDQRAVHPAYDDSHGETRKSSQGGGREAWQGENFSRMDNRRRAECVTSLNNDDLVITHKMTHAGGLLHLSTQTEPPRPHSNPNPACHTDYTFHHHQHEAAHYGGSAATGSNTRGPAQGRRQLFDPKNPSKPIVVSDSRPSTPKFEDTDGIPTPGVVSGLSSPESAHVYPPPFYPPLFGLRLPLPHFHPPPNPYMAMPTGSIPPHVFYRFPGMSAPDIASFYSSSDVDSEGMMSTGSKAQCRVMAEQMLRDSHPFDSQLGNILSRRPHSEESLRMVNQIRAELANRLEQVILLDIEVANKHNVEQLLWKSVYYQVMESYRKRLADDPHDSTCKQRLIEMLDEGTRFFENLLKKLQSVYGFDLEVFTDGDRPIPENVNRNIKIALLSAQRVMMFLGDIARYREQSSDTTNYGKARHWYLKAQRIQPRNGRPYNQLAILAVYTRRKLDAVYYYMRSLAASNPILTARESLMSLFDEVQKKVDAVDKKRFDGREQRQALKQKRQCQGPRVEIWVLPDGTSTQDRVGELEDEGDLSSLSAIELNKRFVLTYLNVHGKLFTKINFEVFAESCSLMLQEFQTLIQHSPCVFSSTRLLQLMVINMFSIDNTALKDESLKEDWRSLLQEHAVEVGLEMFGLLVTRSCELLTAQLESQMSARHSDRLSTEDDQKHTCGTMSEKPSLCPGVLDEDVHIMLPALKTWVDWMMCHAHLWNPQPLNRPPELGPQIDVWKNLATLCDQLNTLEAQPGCLIREQQPGYEPVILHEDTTLSGFVPMLSAPQEVFYADTSIDQQQAEDWLRIEKLRLFGEYLCGVEPPMLAFNVETGRYYSVAPSPTRSEEKLVTDSTRDQGSGDESDDVVIEYDDSEDDGIKNTAEKDSIQKLKAKKAELRRKRQEREKNKENMEAILDSHRYAKIELEIRPIFLVPDTNCFIDHFSTLRKILHTKKYTLVVPLVVISELDGLARGARDRQYDSPDHAQMVKSQAHAAVHFLELEFEVKNPNLRAQTSKGSILETIAFRSEESEHSGVNDDIILNCCLHYCKDMAREFMPKDKDCPVRLYREVVLLTDDRNLRLKAHTCHVPVKDVPSFKKWSQIS